MAYVDSVTAIRPPWTAIKILKCLLLVGLLSLVCALVITSPPINCDLNESGYGSGPYGVSVYSRSGSQLSCRFHESIPLPGFKIYWAPGFVRAALV